MAGFALAAALVAVLAALAWSAGYARWAERRWPADGRLVDTRVGRLHVRERGAGPAVILIHGAGANARELMITLGLALDDRARVIALDRPGFGGSPGFSSRARLARHADAVAALIEAEGLDRPVVVGHSYGAAVALRLAIDHPDSASGLVLLGPATHGYVGPVAWHNYVAATPVLGPAFCRLLVPIAGPLMLEGGVRATFAPEPAPPGYAANAGIGLLFRPRNFRANALDLAVVNAELAAQEPSYGDIAIPVAVIAGDEDRTVRTASHAEPLAAALPDARLAVLPGGGHMPHYGGREIVLEHVDALLAARGRE